jgi:hypothetical protein
VSGRLTGLRRRLAKVEKALAETAEQEKMAGCICIPRRGRFTTIAFSNKPEEFEAEMNQKCPAHGFRSLGHIVVFRVVGPGEEDERCKLDDLLDEYRARETEYSRTKLEHDTQEA